ncbi:carboxypeptidase-like regulatory domain-containing protein [Lacibacter sp. MH-610]|uniref:carboxypeptidase-like regulatory domain-containing protein n=1 Tax=Lacibacter sp. MH-610 TaxID=3020883 RepID=UPI0038918D88
MNPLQRFLLLISLLFSTAALSQIYTIKGRVVDASTRTALSKATVYINNSTRGTIADDSGYFSFPPLPAGTYEVVASFVGYKTLVVPVKLTTADFKIDIALQLQQKELREVLILTNATRLRYMDLFRKNVLGFTYDAGRCVIKNPEAIQFIQGKAKNDVLAYADEPLEIENPVLGYTVYFTIAEVYFNTGTTDSYFFGYTRYADWMDNDVANKKWLRNRRNVYLGSSLHFFRSLVKKELQKQGFAIQTVASGLAARTENQVQVQTNGTDATVSTMCFSGSTVMKSIAEDSLLKDAGAESYKVFEFLLPQQVYIKYSRNTELKLQMARIMTLPGQPESGTMSGLRLKKSPVLVDYRGILLYPMNVYFDGIWAYERLANMLPEDYEPGK